MKANVSGMSRAKLARNANWKSLLWLGLILIVGAVAIRWTAARNNLLLRATRISSGNLRVGDNYQWLDADTVISFGIAERLRTGQTTPVRMNVHTGASTPMEALNARLGDRRLRQGRDGRLSPDGRQLLFLWGQGPSLNASVAALDGSSVVDYPFGTMANEKSVVWLPDGRRWSYPLEEDTAGTATLAIRSADAPQATEVVRAKLPPDLSAHDLLGFDPAGRAIAVGNVQPAYTRTITESPSLTVPGRQSTTTTTTGYGATKPISMNRFGRMPGLSGFSVRGTMSQQGNTTVQTDKTVIRRGNIQYTVTETITTVQSSSAASLNLLVFAPQPNSVVQHYEAKLPAEANINSMVLSPRGDRIALLLYFARPPAVYPWSRWLGQQPQPRISYALWVCRADGTDLHEIGPEMSYQQGDEQVGLSGLRWLPDGKRVSFIYNDALYTLPAD